MALKKGRQPTDNNIPDDMVNLSFSGQPVTDVTHTVPTTPNARPTAKGATFTPVQIKFKHGNEDHMAALKYYQSLPKGKRVGMVLDGIGFMMAVNREDVPDVDYILSKHPALKNELMPRAELSDLQYQIDELKVQNDVKTELILKLLDDIRELTNTQTEHRQAIQVMYPAFQHIRGGTPLGNIIVTGQDTPTLAAGKDE